MLQMGTAADAVTLQHKHCGGTLSLAFSDGEEIILLSGGADGLLRFTSVDARKNSSAIALQTTLGGTAGTKGVLVELVVADACHWVAPVGRFDPRAADGVLARRCRRHAVALCLREADHLFALCRGEERRLAYKDLIGGGIECMRKVIGRNGSH